MRTPCSSCRLNLVERISGEFSARRIRRAVSSASDSLDSYVAERNRDPSCRAACRAHASYAYSRRANRFMGCVYGRGARASATSEFRQWGCARSSATIADSGDHVTRLSPPKTHATFQYRTPFRIIGLPSTTAPRVGCAGGFIWPRSFS